MKVGRKKMILKIGLVIVYMSLSLSGLILMKLGGNPGSVSTDKGIINFGVSIISLIGLFCYLGSFLLYTRIVVMFDLSYITPLCTGVIQVLTLIASKIVFKESFSTYGIVGASLSIIGVMIMNFKR